MTITTVNVIAMRDSTEATSSPANTPVYATFYARTVTYNIDPGGALSHKS